MRPVTCFVLVLACGLIAEAAEVRDVSFIAEVDGSEEHYVLLIPDGFDSSAETDVLIALHGHGSDRWQFINDERDECRAARDVAAAHGMIFLSPDYRARTSWMGPKAEADLLQIIREIRETYPVRRVFICGGSMGGMSCLAFTALHPDLVAGVAALNGTANMIEYEGFQDAIRESYGGSKRDIPIEYKNRSAEFWPERFTMPVGLTVSMNDESVPPGSVIRFAGLLEKLGRSVLLISREDAGHMTPYEDGVRAVEFAITGVAAASESETAGG